MMKRKTQQSLVPKLRFPQFRDAPGWDESPFGKLYTLKPTNTLSRDQLNYETGTVKNIHYGDIHTKFQAIFDINRERVPFINPSVALDRISNESYCVEGDVIFADASEDLADVGKSIEIVKLNGQRLLSGTHTILGRRSDDRLMVGFGGHLFRSERIRAKIRREAQGTKVAGISGGRLSKINICFPIEEAEQRRIADCLSSLDALVTAEGRKLAALKAHKKGLTQQLFPRVDETQPRLRFLEFRTAKAWNERTISELLTKISIPVAVEPRKTYRQIGVRSHGKGIFHKEPVSGAVIGNKRVFQVVEDAFVVNIIFAWERAVATTSSEEAGMIASHRFPMYVPKSGDCDVRFLKHAFLTQKGKHLLGVASPGGAGRNRTLGQNEFAKLKITLPEKEEQAKIADAIWTIDQLIASQAARFDTLKAFKKGLRQQLFPIPEASE